MLRERHTEIPFSCFPRFISSCWLCSVIAFQFLTLHWSLEKEKMKPILLHQNIHPRQSENMIERLEMEILLFFLSSSSTFHPLLLRGCLPGNSSYFLSFFTWNSVRHAVTIVAAKYCKKSFFCTIQSVALISIHFCKRHPSQCHECQTLLSCYH